MKTSKSPLLSQNKLCQLGLTNTDSYTSKLNSYTVTFATQYFSSSSNVGRAVTTITCSDINNLGSGVTGLTSSQLLTLTNSEFGQCQSVLGAVSSWSTDQLSALVTLTKNVALLYLFFSIH